MVRTMNVEALENGTGRKWTEIEDYLATIGADQLSHKEIARKLNDDGIVTGWWAQSVTVAYEQMTGRRIPGQDCNGEFSVSVSKTLNGTMDEALQKWQEHVGGAESFSAIDISRGPEVNSTEKWRYWRCGLTDGSRVNVNIYQKSEAKAALSIQHERLESTEQIEHWRTFWKAYIKDLQSA